MKCNAYKIDLPKGDSKSTESITSFERADRWIVIKYRIEERGCDGNQIVEKEKIKVIAKEDEISILIVNSIQENGIVKKIVEQAVARNSVNGYCVQRRKRIIGSNHIVTDFSIEETDEMGKLCISDDFDIKKTYVCESRL